jgi:hypothetical protein
MITTMCTGSWRPVRWADRTVGAHRRQDGLAALAASRAKPEDLPRARWPALLEPAKTGPVSVAASNPILAE